MATAKNTKHMYASIYEWGTHFTYEEALNLILLPSNGLKALIICILYYNQMGNISHSM